MMFFNYIKDKVILIMGIVIGVLFAWVKIKDIQNGNLKEDIEEAEEQIQIQAINNEVKEIQAINLERKEVADEDISDDSHSKLNVNTTYQL